MNNKDILLRKFEEFELEEAPDKKKLLKADLLNILHGLEEPDSEDFYIWGLIYYKSADEKEYYINYALEKFLNCFQTDSSNFLACLYTAHCYHDIGDLEKALLYYELVNRQDLRDFQTWRYVKLIEQIGFCNYKLGNKEIARKQFQEVLDWYRRLPMEDRAAPMEMLQCLPESDEIIMEMKEIEDYL